jgi:hypothetical protein
VPELARTIFGKQQSSPYAPHLSLLYGTFDAATRERIVAEVGREFDLGFEARSIHVIRTEGEAKDWRHVAEIPFGG